MLAGIAPLQTAGPDQVSFLDNRKYAAALTETRAGAVIVHADMAGQVPTGAAAIIAPEPYVAWARVAALFHPLPPITPGVHPSAVVAPGAKIDPSAEVGPLAVIGTGAEVGPRCRIGPLAAIGGVVVRRVAPAIGAVVPPRNDRWHSTPTPTMGGMAIAAGTVVGFAAVALAAILSARVPLDFTAPWLPVFLAAIGMFVVGFFDDRLQLSPLAKLVASLAIGAFFVFALAVTEPEGFLPWWLTLFGTVWFAGICHAMNLLDNMDGLAAGVGLIAALFLAWLLSDTLGWFLVILLVALVGAQLGFLYWNRPPARMFMGDCGSLFIGALLGGASLVPLFRSTQLTLVGPFVPVVLILVVPLFDTSFVLVLRRLAGRKASKGGTDHVSHRLASLGFSERSAVRILYLLGLLGGTTALLVTGRYAIEATVPVLAVFGVVVVLLGVFLARVPAYNSEAFAALQKSSFAPFLKDLAFKWHAGQVMLDLVLITICYYGAYRLRFAGDDNALVQFIPFYTATLPVVIGCQLAGLYVSGLYQRSWETFGLRDLAAMARGILLGMLLYAVPSSYLYRSVGFSYGVSIIDALLLSVAVLATRVSFRMMNLVAATRSKRSRRVLVYGAGAFGQLLVREMRANPDWQMNPVAFIDDDPMKAHRWISGVPVRGCLAQLDATLKRYSIDEVILSSPSINGNVEQEIRDVCATIRRPVKRLNMRIQ
jgi:UDP-GlcNAc:undecaprenyl-phosphate GlcNAc-1-phosphate transferase